MAPINFHLYTCLGRKWVTRIQRWWQSQRLKSADSFSAFRSENSFPKFIKDSPYTQSLGCVWVFVTPWTVAHQAPLSRGFSRQEYWSRLPWPLPGAFPGPGIKPESPPSLHWQTVSLPLAPHRKPWRILCSIFNTNTFLLIYSFQRENLLFFLKSW